MVSAESFAGLQGVPTLRFLAYFPVGRRPLDLAFADKAPVQVETAVATCSAERLPLITGRRRQSHPAMAAHLPHFGFFEISHWKIPRLKMKKAQRNAGPV
jgi:hypothetical protein